MKNLPFADLHCHPTLYAFNRMRNSPQWEKDESRFHPWQECHSNRKRMKAGARATHYSQANFARQLAGNVKLSFASFTPIEKGFFIGSAHGDERPFEEELRRWLRGETPLGALKRILVGDVDGAAREVTAILRNDGPLRQLVQKLVMDYPLARVRFLKSNDYCYWKELLLEYDFLKSKDGQRQSVDFVSPTGTQRAEGCYRLIATVEELDRSMEASNEVAVVLTIEGGHVFSVGPDLKPLSLAQCLERIEALKNWEHPVLFLTLAHHFDNGLCGHAHSLIDAADWIMDQEYGLNEGFDEVRGLPVVRELLDLDEELGDRGNKRILIDTRHMSARARKAYYAEVVRPYNASWEKQPARLKRRFPKIPVIMSHTGYSGVATLDEMIRDEDREGDQWRRNGFYSWNINLSAEDMKMIFESEGLAGLCFDRRIIGLASGEELCATREADALIGQIFALVDVVMVDDSIAEARKNEVWSRICIGSDFDGVIHPLKSFATSLDLPRFAEELRKRLVLQEHTRKIAEVGVDEIVEKIAYKNALDFARRHLPAAAGLAASAKKGKGKKAKKTTAPAAE